MKPGISPTGQAADASASEPAQPTKEQIREWLKSRQAKPEPLPNIEQIQHELGWKLP